jgi:hypothetical protein
LTRAKSIVLGGTAMVVAVAIWITVTETGIAEEKVLVSLFRLGQEFVTLVRDDYIGTPLY